MNKKSFAFKTIALTSAFVLNMGLYLGLNQIATELDAYDTVTTLPSTIDLNDCSDEDIRSYYSGLDSLDQSERQGTNLLKNLKPILSNNQKYYSYDSGNKIWQIYEIADRDWEKSPASSTTYGTYSSVTNKITGYKYGNNSDGKNNPYIHALYINRNLENQTKAWGNHNQDAWGINREHIWAKSHGFQAEGTGGARGDPMHLWAANGYANNIHSNNFFAFVDKSRTYTDCGDEYGTAYDNLLGFSLNAGGSEKVFEPQDCDKGDIARSIFYMVARYNNYANEASGFDTDNPNLILVNDLSDNRTTGTSSADTPYGMGLLSDLLAWNKLDPVDEYEIHRNNLLYRNYTNNRNPFIDFPSWADAIWGTADLDGKNYNSTVTTYATPASDPINTTEAGAFSISVSSLDLQVNETAEIYGRNADSDISWTVSDDTVVGLDKNITSNNEKVTVTGLKNGTTTITATSDDDSVTCSVTVTNINYGDEDHPLSVDEAIEVISLTGANETAQPLCVKGIVSSASWSTKYNNFNYVWLRSDDGETDRAFELYHCVLDERFISDYGNSTTILEKEVVAKGYGKLYNSTTYELCESSNDPTYPIIKEINDPSGPAIDDYLDNTSPYVDLLGTETDTRFTDSTTFVFADSGLVNGTAIEDLSIGAGVTIDGYKGSNNNPPKYYDNNVIGEMRVYKGCYFILTCENYITRVEISYSGSDYDSGLTADVGTFDDGVWTGKSKSITFTNSNQTNIQVRFRTISVNTSGGSFEVSDVAFRFGIVFPKADWASIHNEWPISDYGVMIVKKTTLNNTYGVDTVAEAYDNSETLLDLHKKTYAEPWSMDEDNYLITVKLNMTLKSNYNVTYCAAPYIIANGTYYFLDQIETSVNDLASDYLDNGGSSLSTEALTLLSTLH